MSDNTMPERMSYFFGSRRGLVAAGAVIGLCASLLQYAGNPPNMGICIAGFIRDIVGALGLHRVGAAQYIRPEIIGLMLGATIGALAFREFKARASAASLVYFILGLFAMVGALVFQGCPTRGLLRLAGGDLNAITGLAGFICGVGVGVRLLKAGFTTGRAYPVTPAVGWIIPIIMVGLLGLAVFHPTVSDGGPIYSSVIGAGSMHAAVWISLGAGVLIGFLAQRTRFCTMGAVRDVVLMRDTTLMSGIVSLVLAAFVTNLMLGQFRPGSAGQPVASPAQLWNFLGMVLVGLASALAGGCPARQVFLTGEGNGDSALFLLGMAAGGGLVHNLNLARPCAEIAKPATISTAGMIAVLFGLIVCGILGLAMRETSSAQ